MLGSSRALGRAVGSYTEGMTPMNVRPERECAGGVSPPRRYDKTWKRRETRTEPTRTTARGLEVVPADGPADVREHARELARNGSHSRRFLLLISVGVRVRVLGVWPYGLSSPSVSGRMASGLSPHGVASFVHAGGCRGYQVPEDQSQPHLFPCRMVPYGG